MIDMILDSLVYILAIYGLIEIIKNIYYIMGFTNLNKDGIYVIIGVKNQEKCVDVVLRSILFRVLYGKEDVINHVILTDLDSSDNTMKKLKSFERENDGVKVLSWRKCKKIVDLIDE